MDNYMIKLNNGIYILMIGYGTWKILNNKDLEKKIAYAIGVGYRLIDTAYHYNNEKMLDKIKQYLVKRGYAPTVRELCQEMN